MIRVADYIAQTLASHGIGHVFMVTGGGAMHLNDAFGRTPGLEVICCHHEQACAMAAESYYRLSGRVAAVNVTSGPGGTNAITGVFGAWTDSCAMIVVSGQVKFETVVRSTALPLRQLGDQELDVVKLVAPITKYAVMVEAASRVRYHLEAALYHATSGRPGPVWLDVPMDVQGAKIDPEQLEGFTPPAPASRAWEGGLDALRARFATAQRPVIYAGSGVRLAGAVEELRELASAWGVPVVTAFNAHDLVPEDAPTYVGRPGTVGDRAGNFAVQNADWLLVIGSRLNIRQVGYAWHNFARGAWVAMVDIDPAELAKPTLRIDLPLEADARQVLQALLAGQAPTASPARAEWLDWCLARRARYPVVLDSYREAVSPVNPYHFMEALFEALPDGARVVTGDGSAVVMSFQVAKLKPNQRLYSNSGCAAMGYDLPAAIGASVAAGRGEVVCLAGDGSIMMNLQELQTIVGLALPIKVFIINNLGYLSIKQTQQAYFPDNPVGCDPASGVSFPSFEKLAWAFGLPYLKLDTRDGMAEAIARTLATPGPAICEVMVDARQVFAPKASSRALGDGRMVSAPLEDLAPFLDRDELATNLLVPPVAT